MKMNAVYEKIESMRDDMVNALCSIIRIPAISPKSGGEGEAKKAELITRMLNDIGFDSIERYDAPDNSAPTGVRPNIVARMKGEGDKNLWIVVHMDVVPPGDLRLWKTNPFEPVVKDGKIIGRGAEDNGQELIASLFALKALKSLGYRPKMNVNLAIVADEETGSNYGIKYLIDKGLFNKEDLILVPDGGNSEGTLIEIAEKSIVWIKFTTKGKQCHASMPDLGINAFKVSIILANRLIEELPKKFNATDELFDRPYSTFEPTKKEANVPNVNTIPGEDIFYMDCRILPLYNVNDVLEFIQSVARDVEKETGARISVEVVQGGQAPPPTPKDAEIVGMLSKAIKKVYGVDAKPGGIGGGTCAAIFRQRGYNAVVWSKIDDTAHSPNEYAIIDNLVGDAKVYATLFLES